MIDPTSNIPDLPEELRKAIERLGAELEKIDGKIDPVIEEEEAAHPDEPLYRANLEMKQTYIEQSKISAFLQTFVSVEEIRAALLE